jgi:hypothetical protein
LEEEFITRPFNISFIPIAVWEELDAYCKQNYGNNRRAMIVDLMRKEQEDFKNELLWAELEALSFRIGMIENKKVDEPKKEEENPRKFRTFGGV